VVCVSLIGAQTRSLQPPRIPVRATRSCVFAGRAPTAAVGGRGKVVLGRIDALHYCSSTFYPIREARRRVASASAARTASPGSGGRRRARVAASVADIRTPLYIHMDNY
jgi:hypothetical protein